MSFAERVAGAPPAKNRRTGAIEVWIESLPPEEQEAITAIMKSNDWTNSDIVKAIAEEGGPVTGVSNMSRLRREKFGRLSKAGLD